jgi:hypothetical protein
LQAWRRMKAGLMSMVTASVLCAAGTAGAAEPIVGRFDAEPLHDADDGGIVQVQRWPAVTRPWPGVSSRCVRTASASCRRAG